VGEIRRLAGDLQSGVDRLVDIALRHRGRSDRAGAIQDDMMDWLLQAARAHAVELDEGVLREVFKGDVDLNTQGLEFWLDHVA
jgi:hypothetical protein